MDQRTRNNTTGRHRGGRAGAMALVVVVSLGAASTPVRAGAPDTLIAYWNFNTWTTGHPQWQSGSHPILDADFGSGVMDVTGFGGSVLYNTSTSGSGNALNALFGDPAGRAFVVLGLNGNFNGGIDFTVSMANRQDLVVSYTTRRGNIGAYMTQAWLWSIDGENFNFVDDQVFLNDENDTAWRVNELDLSGIAALADAPAVTLRLVVGDATQSGHTTRFDNIQFNAALIPSPGAAALLWLSALALTRRRR